MKNNITFLVLVLCMQVKATHILKMENGIRTKELDVTFNYNAAPKHQSIVTAITNNTNRPMSVIVDPGIMLESEFSKCQNHLITKRDTIKLKAREIKIVKLTGMCCERKDHAPTPNSKFTLIKNKRADLITLCNMIDSLNLNGYESQTAIWCLADSSNPNNIYGADSSVVMKLRHYVGRKLQMRVEPYNAGSYVQWVRALPSIVFNGTGELILDSIEVTDNFVMELYDADSDIKVQTVRCDKIFIQRKNLSLFISNIRLNSLNPQTNYIVRLNKNGVVNMEWLYVIS